MVREDVLRPGTSPEDLVVEATRHAAAAEGSQDKSPFVSEEALATNLENAGAPVASSGDPLRDPVPTWEDDD